MMKCDSTSCGSTIASNDDRIEICTCKTNWKSQTWKVSWKQTGDAVLHINCWEKLLKASRSRNPKNDPFKLSHIEKSMIKAAAKTAERHDSLDKVKNEAKRVASLISGAKHCCTFTGAGISTAAGIGDYRGKKGKWTEMDREEIVAEDTLEPPKKKIKTAENEAQASTESDSGEDDGVPYEDLRPTYTHEAICKLVEKGFIKYVISQNGDGLHPLSGLNQDKLSELHGNVFIEYCEKCDHRYERSFYVMDDVASEYYEELEDNGTTDIVKPTHAKKCQLCGLCHRTGRKCDQEKNGKVCGGFLVDTIINFKDNLEEEVLNRAIENSQRCDLMLSLGTTMTVTPASDLIEMGKHPLRIVICNRQKTQFDDLCSKASGEDKQQLGSRVFGDCDPFMREVMKNLLEPEELKTWEDNRNDRLIAYDKQRRSSP